MRQKTVFALALAWLLCAQPAALAGGAPALTILNPAAGSTLLSGSVTVNGTARGSQVDWQEALKEDFEAGTLVNLSNDAAGTLALNRVMYDTFDGGQVDPARWTVSENNGIRASISGGKLQLNGQGTADAWGSFVQVVSTVAVSDRMNGSLDQFMEVGTAAYSVIGIYQDAQNFIAVGRGFDFFGLGPGQKIVLVKSASGTVSLESLGDITEVSHKFEIAYNGTSATFYMDGSQLATRPVVLSNARCVIRAAVNATGEFINVNWDDVSLLYAVSGRYTSAVQDTLSAAPALAGVAWTASLPAGLSLDVQLRSADNAQMQGAGAWAEVTSGQSSGLPASKQFLQYAVLFGSPAGNATPLFRDITVSYICAVKAVDVSTDNRTTWTRAFGKEDWNITLSFPDGPSRIWARVTDVSGAVQYQSVNIDVDTTEPTVSLMINDGGAMTPIRTVNLTLSARDDYGVAYFAASEDPALAGAEWRGYTNRVSFQLSDGDGPKTVYARVRDRNGWESAVVSASIYLDTLAPAGTVYINTGGNYTKSPTVTLHLNATDASGVSDMLISNRNDFSGDDWVPYAPVYTWTVPPGNGVRTVHVKFRDPAGHASAPASASIVLDTVPPVFTFAIENNSIYALKYDIELEIGASDNYAMGEMLLSPSSQFQGASWEPWAPVRRWTLTTGEGPTMLYAKVRDAAENEAKALSASIYVDTVAPLCAVSSLPATTPTLSFTVGWNGNDATSGMAGYDVQYREGSGPWTDWQVLTNNTTAVFTGQDNLTYTFRARAHDVAGNVGAYPENPKTATTIKLPVSVSKLPTVSILTPESSAPYKGKVKFEGSAKATAFGRSITLVQWQIDDGAWLNAVGTDKWSFTWDTAGASQGPHTLRVRSFDGGNYSLTAARTVNVDNPPPPVNEGGLGMAVILAIVAVVAVVGAVAGLLVVRRRKRPAPAPPAPARAAAPAAVLPAMPAAAAPAGKDEEDEEGDEEGDEEDEEDDDDEEAAGPKADAPPEAAPVDAGAAGEGADSAPAAEGASAAATEGAPAPAEEGAAPPGAGSALPPLSSTPRPPLELVRQVDPAVILPVVQALLPSLPGELQYMQPELITQLVVTGEQGKSKFGEPIVLIMNRWYYADENKQTFLQRYNW
jgi:hypothetical protein